MNAKYFAVFRLSLIHSLQNKKALIGLSIFLVTCLLIFANLWEVAAAKLGGVGYSSTQLLWYIAFNEWVLVSIPEIQDDIEEDLRSGRLAYLLPRPISYLGSIFSEAMGRLVANLIVLGAVTFLFTWIATGTLPFQPMGLLFMGIFGVFAGILGVLCLMLIGLSAFWLQDVAPFFWIWEKLLFMFGGLILPLAVYPLWMQKIAHFTPFSIILGERSALALDFSLPHAFSIALSLAMWSALACLALSLVYRKSLSILTIEGG